MLASYKRYKMGFFYGFSTYLDSDFWSFRVFFLNTCLFFWMVSFLFGFVDVDEATPACPRSWKLPKSLQKTKRHKKVVGNDSPFRLGHLVSNVVWGFLGCINHFGGDGSCCCFRLPIYPLLFLRFITKYEVLQMFGDWLSADLSSLSSQYHDVLRSQWKG